MASQRRIDSHSHIVPKFYEEAVMSAGAGPTRGSFPEWSPERGIQLMNASDIDAAITSVVPGVHFLAPPRTPPEIANKLSAAIAEAIKLPDVAKRMTDLSVEPIGNTPAEMAVFLRGEVERWGSVIRSAGAKAD